MSKLPFSLSAVVVEMEIKLTLHVFSEGPDSFSSMSIHICMSR